MNHCDTKISVIVPVYNVEEYLDECIMSILKQDLDSYEIILVNDGSTDSSGEICNRYARTNSIIRVFNKVNGGLGSARNKGLSEAIGEYILFIDSDDFIAKDCLSKMYEIAHKDKLDILLFGAEAFSNDGVVPITSYLRKHSRLNTILSGKEAVKRELKGNYITSVCMRLMRREFILETGIWFNEQYIHEDEDFSFLTYIQAERVEIIPNCFYKRRYRNDSIMLSRSFEMVFNGYKYAAESIIKNSKDFPQDMKSLSFECHDRIVFLIISFYCKMNKKDKDLYKMQLKAYLDNEKEIVNTHSLRLAIAYLSLDVIGVMIRAKQKLKKLSCPK